MHVDMDYFFAAIEEVKNPKLKDKPVIIGSTTKRGIVSTCNYKAREYGIHSGMAISIAHKKCKDAVFLPVNFKLYKEVSKRIMKILKKYYKKFEQRSIDEAYLDVSNLKDFYKAEKLGYKIKEEILKKEKLTCSVGISYNKLVAKIASDFEKPDGLTLVTKDKVKLFLKDLPIRDLYGVGKKTEAKLKSKGIYTIGKLARTNLNFLISNLGNKYGQYLKNASNGIDDSPLVGKRIAKSIGREFTFEKDHSDKKLIFKTVRKLLKNIFEDLEKSKFSYSTIKIKLRYEDFSTFTKQKSLKEKSKDFNLAYKIGKGLIEEFSNKKKIRLIGISLSGF